nr:hypothetical protein [Pseudomonas sp.]
RGAKLFQAPPVIVPGKLPQLPAQSLEHTRNYVGDWLVALTKIAEDNAGHSAGREITPEQNEALGKVLATLHASGAK